MAKKYESFIEWHSLSYGAREKISEAVYFEVILICSSFLSKAWALNPAFRLYSDSCIPIQQSASSVFTLRSSTPSACFISHTATFISLHSGAQGIYKIKESTDQQINKLTNQQTNKLTDHQNNKLTDHQINK